MPNVEFSRSFHVTFTENHWFYQLKGTEYFEKLIFPYLDQIKENIGYPKEQMSLVIKYIKYIIYIYIYNIYNIYICIHIYIYICTIHTIYVSISISKYPKVMILKLKSKYKHCWSKKGFKKTFWDFYKVNGQSREIFMDL